MGYDSFFSFSVFGSGVILINTRSYRLDKLVYKSEYRSEVTPNF